jgi:hypothetical protein
VRRQRSWRVVQKEEIGREIAFLTGDIQARKVVRYRKGVEGEKVFWLEVQRSERKLSLMKVRRDRRLSDRRCKGRTVSKGQPQCGGWCGGLCGRIKSSQKVQAEDGDTREAVRAVEEETKVEKKSGWRRRRRRMMMMMMRER